MSIEAFLDKLLYVDKHLLIPVIIILSAGIVLYFLNRKADRNFLFSPKSTSMPGYSMKYSEKEFLNMFENMNEGFCLIELQYDQDDKAFDYIFLAMNKAYQHTFQIEREALIGKNASTLSQSGKADFLNLFNSVAQSRQPTSFETYLPGLDKYLKYSVFSPESNKVATLVIDVTVHKKNEALMLRKNTEIAEQNDILKESAITTEILLNAPIDPIILIDRQGYVIDCNKAASDWLKTSQQELIGKCVYNYLQEKAREAGKERIKTAIQTAGKKVYLDVLGKKHYETHIIPVKDEKNYVNKIVVYSHDITSLKKKEKQLIDSRNRAERSEKLKSSFLANMSHEIRTPMNSIVGFSKLISKNNVVPKKRDQFIGIIQRSSEDLLRIINDIVDFSKIEAGQMEVYEVDCHVNHLLEDVLEFFDHSDVYNKNVEIRMVTTVPGYKSNIKTDPERLKQVLFNLISNALKFTDEGFVEFGYHMTTDNQLKFYVKDTGIGISEENQEKIFERFVQTGDPLTTSQKGTGLGLSISKALVERMGGKIWLESNEGEGTTFYFILPYKV